MARELNSSATDGGGTYEGVIQLAVDRAWAELVQVERKMLRLAAERHAEESLQAARANADAALRNVRTRTLR